MSESDFLTKAVDFLDESILNGKDSLSGRIGSEMERWSLSGRLGELLVENVKATKAGEEVLASPSESGNIRAASTSSINFLTNSLYTLISCIHIITNFNGFKPCRPLYIIDY
jgi:hypothetical protein